jgi:hypothetical protein
MPPKKRVKKSRARKPVKKGLKQKQKQKQQQKVNVSVSAGGSGGGGTQFIPMPSAPAFDYAQLANLIRPAATVDVPIRAQANPEPIAARAPEAESLKELTSKQVSKQLRFSEGEPEEIEFESMPESMPESIAPKADIKQRKPRGPYGSTKQKYTDIGRNIQNVFAMGAMERPSSQQSLPTYFDVPESGTESEVNVRSAFQRLKEKKKQEIAKKTGVMSFGELTGGGSSSQFV